MRNIKFLDLTGNIIKHACSHIATVPNRLELLRLASNLVYAVNKNCFKEVEVIDIGFEMNRIRHLEQLAFQNQALTKKINLDGNDQLEYLSLSSFLGLKNLAEISLLQNNLIGIDKHFFSHFFSMNPLIKFNIDNILLCCISKVQNIWCNLEENKDVQCPAYESPAYWPLGLVLGCTESFIRIIMYVLYLRGYLSKLIKVTSYTSSLVGLYINQALYGLSLTLTDTHVEQVKKERYILLT